MPSGWLKLSSAYRSNRYNFNSVKPLLREFGSAATAQNQVIAKQPVPGPTASSHWLAPTGSLRGTKGAADSLK